MVIGAVNPDSGVVDVTTDVSVVGKAPGDAATFSLADFPGAGVDATTEVSSVGNCVGDSAAEGEGSADVGSFSAGALPFTRSSAAC